MRIIRPDNKLKLSVKLVKGGLARPLKPTGHTLTNRQRDRLKGRPCHNKPQTRKRVLRWLILHDRIKRHLAMRDL